MNEEQAKNELKRKEKANLDKLSLIFVVQYIWVNIKEISGNLIICMLMMLREIWDIKIYTSIL